MTAQIDETERVSPERERALIQEFMDWLASEQMEIARRSELDGYLTLNTPRQKDHVIARFLGREEEHR